MFSLLFIYGSSMLRTRVSCGGPSEEGFLGRSGVALPFKGAVCRIESSEEEMRVVEVDLDILKVSSFKRYSIEFRC